MANNREMKYVAAAIIKEAGKILICRRGAGGSCAFLWEFPGGKLERGETPEQCLLRECREELGTGIRVLEQYAVAVHEYPDVTVSITFFTAELTQDRPKKIVHDDMKWVKAGELNEYTFCPADRELIYKIQQDNKLQ